MGILSRHAERRASHRRPLAQVQQIIEVRLSSETVKVVNISRGGLLMECAVRLLPNRGIRLKIIGVEEHVLVRGSIVRCDVTAFTETSVMYRAAVVFDSPLFVIGEEREIDAPATTIATIAAAAVSRYVDPGELNPAF